MERKQVKEALKFCRDIDGETKMRKRVLQDYEDTYYATSGGGMFDGSPRAKYRTSSPTESAAINIPDSASAAMRDLRSQIEQLADLKAAILRELNKLPLLQKNILYDFYISGLQWVQISVRVHYSETQCKKIRNRALDNLGEFFSQNALIKNFSYPS